MTLFCHQEAGGLFLLLHNILLTLLWPCLPLVCKWSGVFTPKPAFDTFMALFCAQKVSRLVSLLHNLFLNFCGLVLP